MLCFYTTSIHAQSISDFSFEETNESWQTNNSHVEFTISSEAKEGTQSAQIINISETSYGIEQIVTDIKPTTRYEVSAYTKTTNTPPLKSFLRIAWYESTDGSGSQIKTNDSEIISEITDWKKISVVAESPEQAHSAKIRLLVSSGQTLFDAITITELPMETVIPTPSVSVSISQHISKIYISEVMAYPNSDEGEWIELFNDNAFDVILTDWYIDDVENGGGSPKLFSLEIPTNGYASYELTSSLFNNSGDEVRLLTTEKQVMDSFDYDSLVQGYSIGKNNDQFCIQIASQNNPNNTCYSNPKLITPTIISSTSIPTILAVSTVKVKISPTPKSVIKQTAQPILKTSTFPTVIPSDNVEIIDLETKDNKNVTKEPWLLVSGSYSVLAFISLVSKTFFFRYT